MSNSQKEKILNFIEKKEELNEEISELEQQKAQLEEDIGNNTSVLNAIIDEFQEECSHEWIHLVLINDVQNNNKEYLYYCPVCDNFLKTAKKIEKAYTLKFKVISFERERWQKYFRNLMMDYEGNAHTIFKSKNDSKIAEIIKEIAKKIIG